MWPRTQVSPAHIASFRFLVRNSSFRVVSIPVKVGICLTVTLYYTRHAFMIEMINIDMKVGIIIFWDLSMSKLGSELIVARKSARLTDYVVI